MILFLVFVFIIVLFILLIYYYSNKNKDEKVIGNIFGVSIKHKDIKNINSDKLSIKLKELKTKNKNTIEKQEYYFDFVRKAKKFEDNKSLEKAIKTYEYGLEYAYNEPILKIHNYAFSIHRLIILYGKTKQIDKLKSHLENSICNHSNWKDVEDWKKRLHKLL